MRLLHPHIVYFALLLFLWGWCSSFQRPPRSDYAQARWQWAQQHRAVDSLLFYQAQLQAAWKATGNNRQAQAQNRQFLAYVLQSELFTRAEKRNLLETYRSTQAWNYAYRVQWHSQYGEADSAYFYQSLLEKLPERQPALLYAYGQLAIHFGVNQQKYREANAYLRQAEAATTSFTDSLLLYPIQVQVYRALGQLEAATRASQAFVHRQRSAPTIDSIALSKALAQLGALYQQQGDYRKATIHIGEALNYLADRSGHAARIGALWYQLANAYFYIENKPLETILYVRNAFAKWAEVPEMAKREERYIEGYQLLAKQFMAVEQLDSSQAYLDRAATLQKDVFYALAEGQAIQAALYRRTGNMAAAQKALQKALEASLMEQGNKGEIVAARWLALGQYYQTRQQLSAAREALTEAFWALSWQPRRRVLPPSNSLFSRRMALTIGNALGETLLALQAQSKYTISKEILEQQLAYNSALLQELSLQRPWTKAFAEAALQTRLQLVEWQWRNAKDNHSRELLVLAFAQAEANRQAVVRQELQRHWEKNPIRPLVLLQRQLQQQEAQQRWYQQRIWIANQVGDSSQLDWYRQQSAANNASLNLGTATIGTPICPALCLVLSR